MWCAYTEVCRISSRIAADIRDLELDEVIVAVIFLAELCRGNCLLLPYASKNLIVSRFEWICRIVAEIQSAARCYVADTPLVTPSHRIITKPFGEFLALRSYGSVNIVYVLVWSEVTVAVLLFVYRDYSTLMSTFAPLPTPHSLK